jgi:hypothetical protein
MSFSVTRRTNEIGVIIGIAAALGVARLIASQLYGIQPHDPFTIFMPSWSCSL